MKTAILLGASGLTGGFVLDELLKDPNYGVIKLFNRTALGKSHPKIQEIICDLMNLEEQTESFKGDVVFCCIGTTKKKTPDQKLYHQIDFGIPVSAAKLCVKNGIESMITISSMGANVKSSIFYSRTKGEMEQAIMAENLPHAYFVQPSFIGGNRTEKRAGEKIGIAIFKFIQPLLIGPLRKYRMIESKTIAKSMILLAEQGFSKKILESDEIQRLADSN